MPQQRFMIAAPSGGLQNDVKPWLIMDDAFTELNNAYIFRGRVRKRFGSRLLNNSQLSSRLRVNVGTTNGSGSLSSTVPGAQFFVGQMFSIGSALYTVVTAGVAQAMKQTVVTTTATYSTTNGAFVFVGAPANTVVWFYPSLPVMGLPNYEIGNVLDQELTMAFDTQFAYIRSGNGWTRSATGDALWQGTNSQFFWAENYTNGSGSTLLFVTNNDATDPNYMRYFDGTTWTSFSPAFSSTPDNFVVTCLIIVAFKGSLLLLNTTENNSDVGDGINYKNRMRYSALNDALGTTAFYENPTKPVYGGVVDNEGTQEAIVSAEFIKDRLIVFFERSTWEIVYTGNYVRPFRWQKINTELGAESTFSTIPFDRAILTFGETGIHSCNGVNVERIDDKIPNEIFDINRLAQGVERVYGIRDYYTELTYWTFPDVSGLLTYPNRVLVYNYKTGSWAFNDETITVFGYFWNEEGSDTWETIETEWQETTQQWDDSILNEGFRSIIAGNQQGWTFLIDTDLTRNAPHLYITNIFHNGSGQVQITVKDHNFFGSGTYIIIEDAQGVTGVNNTVFLVNAIIDSNNFTIIAPSFAGTYTGGGTIATISNIEITTKQYNFFLKSERNIAIPKVDFLVDSEPFGEISVSYYSSSTLFLPDGTQILDTKPYAIYQQEQLQEYFWHPIYPSLQGSFIQLRLFFNDEQMKDTTISWSDFQLHAMSFFAEATSDRLQ